MYEEVSAEIEAEELNLSKALMQSELYSSMWPNSLTATAAETYLRIT